MQLNQDIDHVVTHLVIFETYTYLSALNFFIVVVVEYIISLIIIIRGYKLTKVDNCCYLTKKK